MRPSLLPDWLEDGSHVAEGSTFAAAGLQDDVHYSSHLSFIPTVMQNTPFDVVSCALPPTHANLFMISISVDWEGQFSVAPIKELEAH